MEPTSEPHDAVLTSESDGASQATRLDVPVALYRQARRLLLENEPLRARSSDVMSPSHALSAGELDALASVGLTSERWKEEGASDPLAQSIADFMALLETSFSTSQAAKYLKVDASRVRQRLRERSIYGIEYDGQKRLPRFQFERRKVIPGLADVLRALPPGMSPLDVAEWFLSPNPDLDLEGRRAPASPREWLLSGRSVAAVVALANAFE